MTRQDATSVLITFVVGFMVGGYFYMNGFTFKSPDVATEEAYSGFVIEGKSYGDCESTDGCLSFQLLSDGSYVALLDTGSKEPETGNIPFALEKELQNKITVSELAKQSEEQSYSSCSSDTGGIDYTFVITIEDEEYLIDTCETAVVYSSSSWLALAKLWNYFQTLK